MNRRAFLRTIGAAIAAGFSKLETAMVERPGPLIPFEEWAAQPPTVYGLPYYESNAGIGEWMGLPRYCAWDDPEYLKSLQPIPIPAPGVTLVHRDGRWQPLEGASGDPTSDS